jgi:hypothetical protein
VGRGDSSRGLKCPNTPCDAQVLKYCCIRTDVNLGCKPNEFPQR